MIFNDYKKTVNLVGTMLLVVALTACGGFLDSGAGLLGVPYSAQEQFDYCVPASVQMWRNFDGLSYRSQDEIAAALNGTPCSPDRAVFGVQFFTHTGWDAFLNDVPPQLDYEFFSRQVTSIDNDTPVMVVIGSARNHVGIMNGGSYQQQGSFYQWNEVYLHDPDPGGGPNRYFTSDEWIQETCGPSLGVCGQVISFSASYGWDSNYQNWGHSVTTYDGSQCCNQEYKE